MHITDYGGIIRHLGWLSLLSSVLNAVMRTDSISRHEKRRDYNKQAGHGRNFEYKGNPGEHKVDRTPASEELKS